MPLLSLALFSKAASRLYSPSKSFFCNMFKDPTCLYPGASLFYRHLDIS
jgi:hypothetical protein